MCEAEDYLRSTMIRRVFHGHSDESSLEIANSDGFLEEWMTTARRTTLRLRTS